MLDAQSGSFGADPPEDVVAAVFVADRSENFIGTVRHLADDCGLRVVVGSPIGVSPSWRSRHFTSRQSSAYEPLANAAYGVRGT